VACIVSNHVCNSIMHAPLASYCHIMVEYCDFLTPCWRVTLHFATISGVRKTVWRYQTEYCIRPISIFICVGLLRNVLVKETLPRLYRMQSSLCSAPVQKCHIVTKYCRCLLSQAVDLIKNYCFTLQYAQSAWLCVLLYAPALLSDAVALSLRLLRTANNTWKQRSTSASVWPICYTGNITDKNPFWKTKLCLGRWDQRSNMFRYPGQKFQLQITHISEILPESIVFALKYMQNAPLFLLHYMDAP